MTDAELVGYLDDALPANARAAVEARIAISPDTAARLETLRRRTARMSMLLSAVDPAPAQVQHSAGRIRPGLSRGQSWVGTRALLKAAAAVLLTFGVALAVPASRAWLLENIRDLVQEPVIAPTPLPEPTTAAPPASAPFELGFTVATDTFDVHVPDAAGVLVIRRGSGDRVRAEAAGAGVTFVALPPRGVRIESAASGDVQYVLTVPARVQAVRIVVADGDVPDRVLALPVTGELRIPLAGSR